MLAIRNSQDAFQIPYAESWASFHIGHMASAEADVAKAGATAFEDRCETFVVNYLHYTLGSDVEAEMLA